MTVSARPPSRIPAVVKIGAPLLLLAMVPITLFLLAQNSGNSALDRYEAWHRANPAYEVQVQAKLNGQTALVGRIRLRRPDRIRLDLTTPNMTSVVSPVGTIDAMHDTRTYDELPGASRFGPPISRQYETLARAFPSFLFQSSLRQLVPPKTPFTTGSKPNELKATFSDNGAKSDLLVELNPDGSPKRLKIDVVGMMGEFHGDWTLDKYAPLSGDVTKLNLEPPIGYVPFAVPESDGPIRIASKLPLAEHPDLAARLKDGPTLIALLDDNGPSQALRPLLDRLRRDKTRVAVLGADLRDPKGQLEERLAPPGKPMLVALNREGSVLGIWLGPDPQKVDETAKEIVKVLAGPVPQL